MGFRARILAAFGLLGLLPLLVTGALGYVVSARLIEEVGSARAQTDLERMARTLDHRVDIEQMVSWSNKQAESWQPPVGTTTAITRAFLVDRDGPRVAVIAGDDTASVAETDLALEIALGIGQAGSAGRRVTVGGTPWVASYTVLSNPRWALVGLGSLQELSGLWGRLRWAYLWFVVLVVLITGAALSMLVRPIVRSLEDLTEATNLIGDGELAPWLPARAEGEVGRLSLATGAMVDRVERMMRGVEQGARMAMVGQLATHLAHEIRNPLSSIRLNLQSLARELDEGRIPTDVGEVTEICLHEIERLDRVATSVLLVGRAPERRPVPGHLHESLRRAASTLGGELSRRRISFYLDMLADCDDVCIDPESMQSVLLNLFMNAAESVGHDGDIRVVSRTRRDEEGRGWMRIEINDTGPGIPSHLRDRIFEPFYTTKPDGTGVGLATALETVTAHGGTLSLAMPSDEPTGASFVMELPLHRSDIDLPDNPALPPRNAHVEPHPSHRG